MSSQTPAHRKSPCANPPAFMCGAALRRKREFRYEGGGWAVKSWGKTGTGPGEFANVLSIAVDAQGNVCAGDGPAPGWSRPPHPGENFDARMIEYFSERTSPNAKKDRSLEQEKLRRRHGCSLCD